MNAIQFASSINATATHVLDGACAHISLHVSDVANGFAVTVFDAKAEEIHVLPTLVNRDDASAAVWMLRDAFYAASGEV